MRGVLYLTATELLSKIPMQDRDAAVDDGGSGVPDMDLLTQVIAQACDEVDTFFAIRGVPVPVDPVREPLAKQAALHLALETLYTRRGHPAERNPQFATVGMMRKLLNKVADGTLSVQSAIPGAASASDGTPAAGEVISTVAAPSLTHSQRPGIRA